MWVVKIVKWNTQMIMLVYTREECTCVDSCELVYNNVSIQQMVLFSY